MKGFKIISKGYGIDECRNGAGQFILKACDENIEIFQVKINPGKSILCLPQDSIGQLNACIVIYGRIRHEISGHILEAGDMYTFYDINEVECFKSIEESLVMMIAKRGHYHSKLERINLFCEQIDQIHKRDGYTGKHCESVGNLAAKVATILKLNEQQIDNILFAGKVHDLGKINIPDSILNKPGKLTSDEYELMKKHTLYSHDMVKQKTNNNVIAVIVRDHHERLDGSGYPNGLKGDQISIEARIISVIDVFNAMITDRPYKKGMQEKDALLEIQEFKGILYDPEVVNALADALFED